MIIKAINTLRGPNYWSIHYHKLIVIILDLEELEEKPSDKIEGFNQRLKKLIPSLYAHRCSVGKEGGFFERLDGGTWMGHIAEHIALEIQSLAGMDTGFGRTRGYGEKGVYSVVFAYVEENVGRYAAQAAVRICEALVIGKEYNLKKDIREMRELAQVERLGSSTSSIVKEAESREIPWIRLNQSSLCQLGYGSNQKRIQATVTSETSSIGVELASDKGDTKYLLEQAGIAIPRGEIITNKVHLKEVCNYVGFPLVIKPIDGNHGRGITVKIKDYEDALLAFLEARKVSQEVIIERYIKGDDYRLLVINNKLVAAAKRTPAHVIGDGESTIKQLVTTTNKDPRRGYGHERILTKISLNKLTKTILRAQGFSVESVPKTKEKVILKDTANLSTGGTAEDVTEIVHPQNIFIAERISRIIDLDICGIDVMTTDISKPLQEAEGAILEVNAGPGFRMHLGPTIGLPKNVAAPVVDKLFPHRLDTGRIPIIAITGTNGKTTISRLIAHMAKMHGCQVGYTTSDGVYIQNRMVMKGDCTGPSSAQVVLRDPTVNIAVLECARGGILRAGLAFKKCDVAIVTNVSGDHLGLSGIHTLEQLAKVKSVLPETVLPNGYAILNADDDLVFRMRESVNCNVALFSMYENNPRIKALQKLGGITAVYENGYVTLFKGTWKMRIMKAKDIPLTFDGKATFMIQNILGAIIAANVSEFGIDDMKVALSSFTPSINQTPGRLNLFRFENFSVLIDYAHNPAGMLALQQFTDNLEASVKVGIITGLGDRREKDTNQIGSIAAEMFDEIIIRLDKNLRGRTAEELITMLKDGINKKHTNKKTTVIPSEKEALNYAIKNARKGSLIVLCTDDISEVLKLVKELKEKEEKPT